MRISHKYVCIPSLMSLPLSPSHSTPLDHHRMPGWASCVIYRGLGGEDPIPQKIPKGLALALKPCLPLRNRKSELKQGATLLGTSKQCQEGELGFCWASPALLQAPSLRRCSQRRLAGLLPGEGLRTRIIRHMLLPGCNQPASRDTLGPQV